MAITPQTMAAALRPGEPRPYRLSLPDIPWCENRRGCTGQASESTGAEAEDPCGEVRRPAELIERDSEQERSEEPGAKADA